MRRYAIIFVCQQGALEAQAAVLAASLRRFARFNPELIAAIPEPAEQWGRPSAATLSFLAKLGVRTVGVSNGIDANYPIANKIGCLSVATEADKLILLDTDMVAMRPWEDDDRFAIPFNARPAAGANFTTDQKHWDAVYAACGTIPLPGKVRTIYTGVMTSPYFNSGFVAVPANIGFGDVWLDCCRGIDRLDIPNKRPFLDQIALPATIAKLGLAYDCLDERFNHSIHCKPLDARRLPFVCHYHYMETLMQEPAVVRVVRELADEHPELAAILSADPQWQHIVSPAGAALALGGLDLILTGIPRSGTSYLCNLLNRYDNCVVLNEPEEIIPALQAPRPPWDVVRIYREFRRKIITGEPVRNKFKDGKVTEDTARGFERASYQPHVTSGDFVLGVKRNIPFLGHLRQMRSVMPAARVVACIRNPFDTIASWKANFQHLREADVTGPKIANLHDPSLGGYRLADLQGIASEPDLAIRRAMFWRHMAEQILESLEHLVLVRYDQFVADPGGMLKEILQGGQPGQPAEMIMPSAPRSSADKLDAADVQAIRALCSDAAVRLGVYRATP